jgi:uncharacterized protein YjlB
LTALIRSFAAPMHRMETKALAVFVVARGDAGKLFGGVDAARVEIALLVGLAIDS